MGQKIIQSKYTEEVDTFLYKYSDNLQFVKLYNNGILSKTALVFNKRDNVPLIIKVFFKTNYEENEKKLYEKYLALLREYNKKINQNIILNYAPIIKIENHERAGIIIKQYFGYNLKERMFQIPYFSKIEKLWLIFQILFSLKELHSNGIIHGNIKLENILLTSYNSLFLTDISPFKPVHIIIDDITSYEYFFGALNKTCYLSPERVLSKKEFNEKNNNEDFNKMYPSMDIFSAGIVIAELLTEIHPFFLLNQLWEYKYGRINIKEKLKNIKDENLKILLFKMLEIDPEKRINSEGAFIFFLDNICPLFIKGFLVFFNCLINKTKFWKPDLMIGLFYKHWKQIWKLIFGYNEKAPLIKECLNFSLINKIFLDSSLLKIQYLIEKEKNFKLLINIKNTEEIIKEKEIENDKKCILLLFNYIVEAMQNVKYESSNWVALEMIKCILTKVPDKLKLLRIIPYFIENIKRHDLLTRLKSLKCIIDSLLNIDYNNLELPKEEYYYFHGYIFPYFIAYYHGVKNLLNKNYLIGFINLIGKIIEIESKFLNLVIKIKLKKYTNEINNIKEEINKEENNEEKKKNIKDKRIIIFQQYHKMHLEFKKTLFSVISKILTSNIEDEVLVVLFNNFPIILKLFSGEELNEFKRQTLSYINSRKSKIQIAVLKNLPFMTSFSRKDFENVFVPCIEFLIYDNEEIKIYESFNLIISLIEKDFIKINCLFETLNTYFKFISHPNILIRKKVLKLAKIILKKNNQKSNDCLMNYYQSLFSFEKKLEIINEEIIDKYHKESLSRILCQINNKYEFSKEHLNENKHYLSILDEMTDIFQGKEMHLMNLMDNIIDNNNKNYEQPKIFSFIEVINRTFDSYIKKGDQSNFFYQLYPIRDPRRQLILKKFHSNNDISFKIDEKMEDNFEIIYIFFFKIFYLFKVLDITYNEIGKEYFTFNKLNSNIIEKEDLLSKNKNIQYWRPKGKLLTTIYNKSTNPIEKIIPMNNSIFLSIDNQGEIIFRKLEILNKELYVTIKHIKKFKNDLPILYKSTIKKIGNDKLIFASNNALYLYEIGENNKLIKVISIEENEYITTTLISKYTNKKIFILLSDTKGRINLFDLRIRTLNEICQFPLDKGFITCGCKNLNYENEFLFGTSDGFIFNVSLNLNSITHIYEFENKKPIIGIKNYLPNINNVIENNGINYYIIYFGDSEIHIWNFNTLNCEILMKVNVKNNDNDNKSEIDYPILSKRLFEDNSLINLGRYFFEQLRKEENVIDSENKFFYYNGILRKNRFIPQKSLLDYLNQETIIIKFNEIKKIFNHNSNSQIIFSPFYDINNNLLSINYLISGGNDTVIRYWDISKETLRDTKSYIINGPLSLVNYNFTQTQFNKNFFLIQSNEEYNSSFINDPLYNNYSLKNYSINGMNNKFLYGGRFVETGHKNIITDIQNFELNDFFYDEYEFPFLLLTSSLDGTIKIWK